MFRSPVIPFSDSPCVSVLVLPWPSDVMVSPVVVTPHTLTPTLNPTPTLGLLLPLRLLLLPLSLPIAAYATPSPTP